MILIKKETQEAQDELIRFMLAPMQREIDRLKQEKIAWQKEYDRRISAGECVQEMGDRDCPCRDCELNSMAYDIVDDKPAGQTALDALLQDKDFIDQEAQRWVDIFDELGIFTDEELFLKIANDGGFENNKFLQE